MRSTLAFLLCCVASVASAVDHTIENHYAVPGDAVGGYVLFEDAKPIVPKPVAILKLTEIDGYSIAINGVTIPSGAPAKIAEIEPHCYLIERESDAYVSVLCTHFGEQKQDLISLFVQGANEPEPEPEPGPSPPDPPDPNPDVPNAYGVGQVAYQNAVTDDMPSAVKYVAIFRNAAEFLFGRPTQKAIIKQGEPDANNPDRNVVAWMEQEFNAVTCRDEATCKRWAEWREKVNTAINAAQNARPYTRADWYQTFNEVADALEIAQR